MGESFTIDSLSMFELIVAPAFQDLVPATTPYQGMLQEFTLMGDVSSKRTIVDLKRVRNILQRRDLSCDLVYKKVMGASTRQVTVDELYAATNQCKHEFYAGCLKDWYNNDPVFGERILPFFQDAARLDIAANSYFGDISRPESNAQTWSTTKFDGVFKWLRAYLAAGVIPSTQAFVMPVFDARANPAQAYAILQALVDKQNTMMRSFPNSEKEIYCDQPLMDGYLKYLKSLGTSTDVVLLYANGVKLYSIDGVLIRPITIWEPILEELYGAVNYHCAVLTLAGNFVFATDNKYGEGPDGNESLMVWFERKDQSWYYQMFLKAGTQIALPEHVVFSVPGI